MDFLDRIRSRAEARRRGSYLGARIGKTLCFSQDDFSVANAAGATVRADINANLQALATLSSGAAAPSTTYAYQWWADTTTGLLKIRNAANSAWITVGVIASLGSALVDAAGDLLQGSAADTLARLAIGAAGTRLHSTGSLAEWQATWFKVGSFTRDISLASGTQAITGVGFTPKAVLFIGCISDTVSLTAGFDDGTIAGSVVQNQPAAVGNFHVDTTDSVWGLPAGGTGTGTAAHGHITTLGSDGFTITWTKDGSPTGTLTVNYIALR